MKVIVLGADGYLGRPTVAEFSKRYDVIGVDSLIKTALMANHDVKPLNEVRPYNSVNDLVFPIESAGLHTLIEHEQPDAIIDYAEIPSAPYSMMSDSTGTLTIRNNVMGTLNLVQSVHRYSPHTHIIKLGTMGEYGTPNIDIEEGWLDIHHNGRSDRLLYPKTPGSLYHLSKVHDSDLLAFAARTWGLRVTDLNQGFVYGTRPDTRFCYDHLFGTALNRFVVQAVAGIPLTVYGAGGQTRGIINIEDTLQCVELALQHPAKAGEFRVMNQFTEQYSINEIARMVAIVGNGKRLQVKVDHITNPRVEAEKHYYNAKNTNLKELGLKPRKLNTETINGMLDFVIAHKEAIRVEQIMPTVAWK